MPNRSWKEVRFFDVPDNYQQGMGWYLGHFPWRHQARGRISLDASPSYLYFPQVPSLIRKHLGAEIRMIAVLRDPVDRAYSAWRMYHSFGTNAHIAENNRKIADRRSFSQAVSEELGGRLDRDLYPYAYVGRGHYADQLKNYYDVFGERNLLVLEFSRLHSRPGVVLDEITDFLGIARFSDDQKSQILSQRHNAGLAKSTSESDETTLHTLREYYQEPNARLNKLLGWNLKW